MLAMPDYEPVLLRNVGVEGSRTLEVYKSRGGYQSVEKALTQMTPDEVVAAVKPANLRGPGGAGCRWLFQYGPGVGAVRG